MEGASGRSWQLARAGRLECRAYQGACYKEETGRTTESFELRERRRRKSVAEQLNKRVREGAEATRFHRDMDE